MKDHEKSLEIRSKFYAVLSEIHGEKLTIGLQIVEAKNGMIFFYPIIQDENGKDVLKIKNDVDRKVVIYLNHSKNADYAEYEAEYYSDFPEEEKVTIEEDDDHDDAIDALLDTIEDNDILVIGGIEDLCVDDDLDPLISLLSELDFKNVVIASYIEGIHEAKYFYDMVFFANNLK